jgi:hypothetical protein
VTTDRSFTTQHTGPVVLDLTQNTGRISISVNPQAQAATVILSTSADEGPSADAITNAKISESRGKLTVKVKTPDGGSSFGGVTVSGGSVSFTSGGSSYNFSGGSYSSVNVSGGRVIVNGVDVTDTVNSSPNRVTEITTSVVLPADSEVLLNTKASQVTVKGELKALDLGATSGSLTAETVGDLSLDMTSGSARITTVRGRLNANMTSGALAISAYSGPEARVNMTSGVSSIHATPDSTGRFHIGLTSGVGNISGTSHLDVRKRVTSGSLNIH